MKKSFFFILLMAFALFSFSVSGQKDDFNGSWKLDQTKSTLPEYTPVLVRIDIKIKGDSLLTERYYDTGDGQLYPFTENVTLDGKEYNITIYDMPRKTKATWSDQGGLTVESTTTANSEDFKSNESWKADPANKTLTISFKNSMSAGEAAGAFVLIKSE